MQTFRYHGNNSHLIAICYIIGNNIVQRVVIFNWKLENFEGSYKKKIAQERHRELLESEREKNFRKRFSSKRGNVILREWFYCTRWNIGRVRDTGGKIVEIEEKVVFVNAPEWKFEFIYFDCLWVFNYQVKFKNMLTENIKYKFFLRNICTKINILLQSSENLKRWKIK